jgi:CubicO group peptidase (beta-lactamase class C family)
MTGLLMADAEIRGNYSLSAPVNNWLSQECYLPGYEGIEITGAHLATHYSGLPGTPDIFSQVNPANANEDQIEESIQKYQTMTAESVYQWVTKTTLYAPPGYQYLYSNLGAAIAGDIVSRAEDSSYPELLTSRLFEPLGMENSGALWSIEDLYKRATGYRGYAYPTDKAHLIMFNNFWTATGGIHSNADDMAIFLAAQLGLVDAPLADAIAKTHTPLAIVTKDPSGFEQGIFWDILHNRDATTIIKKAGETTAHQATIAFNPAEKTGVVILSNTATVGGTHVEEQAIALLERMHVKTPMMAH